MDPGRPHPPPDYVSHGGRFRVRWTVGGSAESSWHFQPRLLDAVTGAVLLDLWGPEHELTVAVTRADGPVLAFDVLPLGDGEDQGAVVVDLAARAYRVAVRDGSLAAVTAQLDAAGLRPAGAPEPATRPAGPPPEGPDAWRQPADDVNLDGRFLVSWEWGSEGHGALWRQPRLVDRRTGAVLLDLAQPDTWDFSGDVVRSADPVVELVVRRMGGGACNVVVDADARTFEIRGIEPPGAAHRRLRERLRLHGLADVAPR